MALLGLCSGRSRPLNIFLHHRWRPISISIPSDSLSVAAAVSSKQEFKARLFNYHEMSRSRN
ncbi:hypothetical protein RchiOBHm_Chr2g0104531 [Rosa chinensis]|uniref:Uncharacterized protein n=1 Tax=Rosa chinensis TaxID=74649 RepID=A0A2P6RN77_ROSCH|nr:hypothetical protein RchiOBHm_Chr2g0104531 [Rosa chinensis]